MALQRAGAWDATQIDQGPPPRIAQWRRMDRILPPDLTPHSRAACWAQHENRDRGTRYFCTRDRGHSGRHAAGSGTWVIAVWP